MAEAKPLIPSKNLFGGRRWSRSAARGAHPRPLHAHALTTLRTRSISSAGSPGAVGCLIAIYGRVVATQKIGSMTHALVFSFSSCCLRRRLRSRQSKTRLPDPLKVARRTRRHDPQTRRRAAEGIVEKKIQAANAADLRYAKAAGGFRGVDRGQAALGLLRRLGSSPSSKPRGVVD